MRKKHLALPLVIMGDILLAAVVILTFFAVKFSGGGDTVDISRTEPENTGISAAETSPEPEGIYLSPWQLKFMDKFSFDVVSTDHSYKSPNVSIEIETVTTEINDRPLVYHVADIYIGSIDNFRTYTAHGKMQHFATQDVMEMDKESDALISMSGDFYSYQGSGFLMRNGKFYREDEANCDICVLYKDGRIDTLKKGEYTNEEILAQEPLQIWNFGPELLDKEGNPYPEFETAYNVSLRNPRSALGYYEPGHYCFVVVDGRRDDYSVGMKLPELAQLFKDLGCSKAYNMDGGGSAVMCFNHERFSRQSNGGDRKLGDILLICETEAGE